MCPLLLLVAAGILFIRHPGKNILEKQVEPKTWNSNSVSEKQIVSKKDGISFPVDERTEVQVLDKFAQVANLYNFNPEITAARTDKPHWPGRPEILDARIPTHGASISYW